MNLLLLNESDLTSANSAELSGRRLQHVREVHQAAVGETIRVGLVNGLMGEGVIEALTDASLRIRFELTQTPPEKLPLTILLALPRPKMLKRIFQTVSTMGVSRLVLMNSYRVEKSFWNSPWLKPESIQEQLMLGLEQAKDTVLPEVVLEKRFKPFVEDRLPNLSAGALKIVAHPGVEKACPVAMNAPTVLAIGPEGGFIPYEVELLTVQGFEPVHLGSRILRVETAVTALTARLFTT